MPYSNLPALVRLPSPWVMRLVSVTIDCADSVLLTALRLEATLIRPTVSAGISKWKLSVPRASRCR
jgi:hypothetical protein